MLTYNNSPYLTSLRSKKNNLRRKSYNLLEIAKADKDVMKQSKDSNYQSKIYKSLQENIKRNN